MSSKWGGRWESWNRVVVCSLGGGSEVQTPQTADWQNVLQRDDEKLLARSSWGTLGNKTGHTQRGGETKSEYTCSIYKYIKEGRCVFGGLKQKAEGSVFTGGPGSLHPLWFNGVVLWTQWWAETEGGTQTPDRSEPSARRRLIENSPAVFPADCCVVAALFYCRTEKNIHTGWKTHRPGTERYKFNSGWSEWAGSVGRMCGCLKSEGVWSTQREAAVRWNHSDQSVS